MTRTNAVLVRAAGLTALTAAVAGGAYLAADWLAGPPVAALVALAVLGFVLFAAGDAAIESGPGADDLEDEP